MRQKFTLPPIIFCLTLLSLMGFGPLVYQVQAEITADATLSHLSFPEGKAAQLTIIVNGTSRNATFELPVIDNIRFHDRGQSSQFRLTNGSVSAQISHTYLVQAMQEGSYTLPAIEVSAGGESALTKPIDFQVTATGLQATDSGDRDDQDAGQMAFLRISETASHYPGEIVPLTLKAYFTQAYRADIRSLPTLQGDGVVMSQLNNEPQQTVESVNGKNYHVLTWQTSLSGIKVGKHPIRFTMEASMLIPQQRRPRSPFGGNSIFDDPFFGGSSLDNFFGGHQRKPIVSESPEVIFEVLPLPTEGQPANFTGAIGDFDLTVSGNPVNIEVGEPITLTMTISGAGNFDRVEAPLFPESSEWKTYSPTAILSPQGKDTTHSGSKVFEQALVIKYGGVTAIPSLSFSYFDPKEKIYISKTSKPIPIQIKGTTQRVSQLTTQSAQPAVQTPLSNTAHASSQQQPAGPSPVAPPAMVGLAPIHLETGSFHNRIVPLFLTTWWKVLFLLSFLLLVGLLCIKMQQRNIHKHPEKQQQKMKKLQLERDLAKIEQAKTAGDGAAFLSLCRSGIQQQLGLLWNIEPAALSLADINCRLHQDSPLIAIFSLAEQAAYGGAGLTKQKMHETFSALKNELEELL